MRTCLACCSWLRPPGEGGAVRPHRATPRAAAAALMLVVVEEAVFAMEHGRVAELVGLHAWNQSF